MKLSEQTCVSILRNVQTLCLSLILFFITAFAFEIVAAGMPPNWGWLVACIPTGLFWYAAGNSLRFHKQ